MKNEQQVNPAGALMILLVVLSVIIIKAAFVYKAEWLAWLFITVPLLIFISYHLKD